MSFLAAETADSTTSSYWLVVLLGGATMVVLAGLQYKRFTLGGQFSTSFMKAYGLILVATLGAVLVFADVSDEGRTGAYTLLGTIAGYLASTKPPKATVEPDDGAGRGAGEDDDGAPQDPRTGDDARSRRGFLEEPLG